MATEEGSHARQDTADVNHHLRSAFLGGEKGDTDNQKHRASVVPRTVSSQRSAVILFRKAGHLRRRSVAVGSLQNSWPSLHASARGACRRVRPREFEGEQVAGAYQISRPCGPRARVCKSRHLHRVEGMDQSRVNEAVTSDASPVSRGKAYRSRECAMCRQPRAHVVEGRSGAGSETSRSPCGELDVTQLRHMLYVFNLLRVTHAMRTARETQDYRNC